MLHEFFMAQWSHPAAKNEWTEQVRKDLVEFDIPEDLVWIKSKSEHIFKKLVKNKAQELTVEMNPRKGKMKNLFYVNLELQEYLNNKDINVSQAKAVFRWKT